MTDVKKIVELNGSYECKFDPVILTGFGNIGFAYGHIYVTTKKDKISINIFNTNEEGRIYYPTGWYEYEQNNSIFKVKSVDSSIENLWEFSIDDEFDYKCRLIWPYGWTEDMISKLKEVILACAG